jgi:branched-chain amino acid transport system substrate-binding protein
MKPRSLSRRLVTVMVLSMLVLTIFLTYDPKMAEAQPIKIGGINALTGPLTECGLALTAGAKLAFDEAGWQVAGRKIEYITEDMGANVSLGVEKCKKLVESDKCSIILAGVLSAANMANAPYAERMKVPYICPASIPYDFTQKSEYVFAASGEHIGFAYPVGRYAADKLGYKTCSMLTLEAEAGYWWDKGFIRGFREGGGKIIHQQRAPRTTTDFAPYLTAMKKADFACIMFSAAPSFRVIKQYRELGLWDKMPVIGYEGSFVAEEHLEEYGDAALGIICQDQWASRLDTPKAKQFVKAYKEKYKRLPGSMDHNGYRIASIALAALGAVKGDTSNPEKLYNAMKNVKMEMPGGPFRFSPERYGISNMYIIKVVKEGGERFWKILYTYKDNPVLAPTAEERNTLTDLIK